MKMETMVPKDRCEEIANQAVVEGTKELQEVIDKLRDLNANQATTISQLQEEVQAQKEANTIAMQTIERLRDKLGTTSKQIEANRQRINEDGLRITQLIGVVANQAQALAKG